MRKQLAKSRYVDPTEFADAYAKLGDKEQAFAWLDTALAEKSAGLQAVKIVPALDQWHSDPATSNCCKRWACRNKRLLQHRCLVNHPAFRTTRQIEELRVDEAGFSRKDQVRENLPRGRRMHHAVPAESVGQ